MTLTKKFAASHFALPFRTTTSAAHADDKQGDLSMTKLWITLTVLCAVLVAQVGQSYGASDGGRQILDPSPAHSVNQVVQWNKNLLVICSHSRRAASDHTPDPQLCAHARCDL